jgi:hypothetical protein
MPRSEDAVGGRADVGAHIAPHHFQRRLTEFRVDVGDRI